MELLQLQYFITVAKEENMTHAAEILHVAQPALSQSVRRLETEMGTKLFDRVGKRIRLNPAGEELLRTVEPMLETLAALPETLQEIADEHAQTVSLNVLVASQLVTQMMIAYKQVNSKSSFRLDRKADSLDWDLRISAVSGQGGTRLPKETERLMEEEIYLAVPAASPLAERDRIALEETRTEPFLTFPQNMPYYHLCNRLWSEIGMHPRVGLESDNPQALRQLLEAGMGIAFWPQYTWGQADSDKIKLLHLTRPRASRIVTLTRNPKRKLSPAAERFYHFCKQYFKDIQTGSEALPQQKQTGE